MSNAEISTFMGINKDYIIINYFGFYFNPWETKWFLTVVDYLDCDSETDF